MSQENQPFDKFCRRYFTAPKVKQAEMIQSALALLNEKPADVLLCSGVEAARLLSVSFQTFWRIKKSGAIQAVTLPGMGRPRYRRADLERLAGGKGAQ